MNNILLDFKIDYELYKRRWTEDHIDRKVSHDTNKLYKKYCLTDSHYISFEEYIDTFGYANGERYASFDDYISYEYINYKKKSTVKRNLKELKKEYCNKEKIYQKTINENSIGDLSLYREINDIRIIIDKLRQILEEFNETDLN